ncbi:MAG: translation initiation factor IF-2 N-terminal domain-containing protein [Gloeotrichia echinulata DVL01]|jgi:hypothetical protein|nr:hypothetical protein [Gloeotrichia echinulata DEX184]
MGFADLSIAEIAADYGIPVEQVVSLCNQLGIAYKHQRTRLAFEDAKAILTQIQILSQRYSQGTTGWMGDTEVF